MTDAPLASMAASFVAPVPGAARRGAAAARQTSMYLAYTSFAVRMRQGRDILKSAAAAFRADTFRELCARFGAGGGQIDFSQLLGGTATRWPPVRDAFGRDRLGLEVSIPSRSLEIA